MLEKLTNFDFNIIKPKTSDSTPVKGLAKEIILRDEVNNFFVQKKEYNYNIHKAYELILGQCTQGLNEKYKQENIWK